MKLVNISIDGQEYPICFSTRVLSDCSDRYGSVEAISDVFQDDNTAKVLIECAWMITKMMAAGSVYAEKHGLPAPPALSLDDFLDVTGPADLGELRAKIMETIRVTGAQDVEVEPSKNAGATPADSARSG